MRDATFSGGNTKTGKGSAWPQAKSLSLIPETFRFAMVYGHNPHTGRQTEPWRLRNVIRWVRPNPPVGALGDKFRPATSELMVFCKSKDRFFDLDAVRNINNPERMHEPAVVTRSLKASLTKGNTSQIGDPQPQNPMGAPPLDWWEISLLREEEPKPYGPKDKPVGGGPAGKKAAGIGVGRTEQDADRWHENLSVRIENPLGSPPLDWWNIPPGGYPGAHYACVDEATEALTPEGWKDHKQLEDGDLIGAYDLKSDRIVWQAAKFVRYDVADEPLVCIEKEQTSQRLTETHRMLVKSRDRGPFVKLAGDVSSGYDLPLSAPWGESGSVEGPGVVLAALLGWFITEGGARPLSRQAYIYQSKTANSRKVDEIRQLLEWSGAPFDERVRDRGNEFPGKGVQVSFVVHDSPLAVWLRDHHKRLPLRYVFEWPEKDAQALFDAMIDGDGHRRADGRISFVQKDKELADAFQCLAIRLGYRATVKPRKDSGVFTVYLSVNRWVTLRGPDGKRAPIPRESYTGVVWCPLVDSTFWLARRNGKPFITGNTWPPELLVKPIKAMTPERVCRVCGEPSRRIVENLTDDRRPDAPAPTELGAYLRSNLKQPVAAVAQALGVPETQASHYFRTDPGARLPDPDTWQRLKVILDLDSQFDDVMTVVPADYDGADYGNRTIPERLSGGTPKNGVAKVVPTGWSDCLHDDYRPGLVLDPFAGSGTTLSVATGHGREAIGIDLDSRNVTLARDRIGPLFFEVVDARSETDRSDDPILAEGGTPQ